MNLKLRKYRESLNLTQADLAKKIGKSFRTVQSWERGESYPNAEAIWNLCEVFGTDPNDFLGWYDEHPREEDMPLSIEEAEVVECFRDSTPQWRTNISMSARAAASASKNEPQSVVFAESEGVA